MDFHAASGAVEDELAEFLLEVALHLQQLEPEHLRVDHDRVGAAKAGSERLVEASGPIATRWRSKWRRVDAGHYP